MEVEMEAIMEISRRAQSTHYKVGLVSQVFQCGARDSPSEMRSGSEANRNKFDRRHAVLANRMAQA